MKKRVCKNTPNSFSQLKSLTSTSENRLRGARTAAQREHPTTTQRGPSKASRKTAGVNVERHRMLAAVAIQAATGSKGANGTARWTARGNRAGGVSPKARRGGAGTRQFGDLYLQPHAKEGKLGIPAQLAHVLRT